MAYKKDSSSFTLTNILHLANGFLLKLCISDSEDFVNNEDFRIQMGCNRETETNGHTGGVTLNGCIYISFASRKIDNLVKLF